MEVEHSLSLELEARQQDEVNSIASIYGDIYTDLTPKGLVWNKKPSPHFQVYLESSECEDRPTISLIVDVEFTSTYPLSSPKVTLLSPKNILKGRLQKLKTRVADLLKEYAEEEVSFVVISDLKEMLDEFQLTTEVVLSLEEERELRLKNEQLKLEAKERERERELEIARKKQNEELNAQILRIRGEYFGEDEEYDDEDDESKREQNGGNEDSSLAQVVNSADHFVFANTMSFQCQGKSIKFRVVLKLSDYSRIDALSSVSKQYVVSPHLSNEIRKTCSVTTEFLFTEVELSHPHWMTEGGKKEIQDLETELQSVMELSHDNINCLVGFQIDTTDDNTSKKGSSWIIRILTDYTPYGELLRDMLATTTTGRVNWALARTWLIQLLPALEYLQNAGVVHKLICPMTVSLVTPGEKLKLCHTSYGYTLLKMIERYPYGDQQLVLSPSGTPPAWKAPELSEGLKYLLKTDVWDLGVLFTRVMLGYNVLNTVFKTPEEFFSNFKSIEKDQYSNSVFDLLSKMLQQKPGRRPSPMEFNAVKFLRDGPLDLDGGPFVSALGGVATTNGVLGALHSSRIPAGGMDRPRRNSLHYFDPNSTTYNPNMGRYERDFEEVGKLGKGGFGEVVKARNRIEGTFYAIKKIKHRAHKLDSLLSEVLSLARLNHQYIVRYYGTWVEEKTEDPKGRQELDDSSSSSEDDFTDEFSDQLEEDPFTFSARSDDPFTFSAKSSSFLASRDNSFQVDFVSNDPQIEFGYSTDEEGNNETEENEDETDSATSSSVDTLSSAKKSTGSRNDQNKSSVISILYIQMEFCENNTLQNIIEQGLPQNPNEYWRLFRQLLEAVSYIHREGFIHRDLKPMNIFIDKSNNIKVGDFGLAKNSQFSSAVVLTSNQVEPAKNKDWSTVVGTVFYTAKEVATGDYDEKVDMYALGIIFFEMCYALGTGMERAQTLNGLRLASVEFPLLWKKQQHEERKIIRLLLDHDPKARPGASELLLSGWLPVEHQDHIIKEALRSLADPASPWQLQVRETLFQQPYVLARDLMFDADAQQLNRSGISGRLKKTALSGSDNLIFDRMVDQLRQIFRRHGALEDICDTNVLFPKLPFYTRENVYEILDKSGSLLQLPYDLTLPLARYLSKTNVPFAKSFKNGFVYRPGRRPGLMPDKYSAVTFDIATHDPMMKPIHDAECLKVADEIVRQFPKKLKKLGETAIIIIINHSDIINSIINFLFENVGIDERKRAEVIGILSQLGIETEPEEVRRSLREDARVPHTVTKDLIDRFDFVVSPEVAKAKLHKAMLDSPHFAKVDRALTYIAEVLQIFHKLGGTTPVLFSPLSNYNTKYYRGGLMFQAVHRVDKLLRRKARIILGGRYDSLIETFANKDMVKSVTPHAVGFQLSSNFLFLLLKKNLHIIKGESMTSHSLGGSRCSVLISSLNAAYAKDSGCEIVRALWNHDISSDIYVLPLSSSATLEDILDHAHADGANWVVLIKNPHTIKKKKNKRGTAPGGFKPLRVKNLSTNKDVDVDYEEVVDYIKQEIDERHNEEDASTTANTVNSLDDNSPSEDMSHSNSGDTNNDNALLKEDIALGPLFSTEISQKVSVVPNDAPRGRKNKREKWESENDAKIAGATLIKQLALGPVISVDAREEVLEMILMISLKQQDEWIRKVIFSSSNLPKSFAINIYNTLVKEAARGTKWVILHAPRTQKTTIVDLER